MSKTQKTSGIVTASSRKDGYQPCQASPVLLLGTRLCLDSGRGLIGKELSPDIEFLPSLADKQTPLHPPHTGLVYSDILVLKSGSEIAPADLPSSTLSCTYWLVPRD